MEEGSEAQKPTTENQPTYGWTKVDGKSVYVPTPQEQEKKKILEQRKSLVKPILDRYIPDSPYLNSTIEDFYQDIAKRRNKSVADLTDSELDDAEYYFLTRNEEKEKLVNNFAETSIPEDDLDEFINIAFETGNQFSPDNKKMRMGMVGDIRYCSDSLERARQYQQFAYTWKEKFLNGTDEATFKKRLIGFEQVLVGLSGANISPRPASRSAEETSKLFVAFTELYDYVYSLPADYDKESLGNLITWGKRSGLDNHDPEQVRRMMDIFKKSEAEEDKVLLAKFIDSVGRYADNHGLNERSVEGLLGKLLPALKRKDFQVDVLTNGGNIWGMKQGEFGTGDFLINAYANEVTPLSINKSLMALREIPTTSLSKFEQNRDDALSLRASFGILRDVIHDQRPYVHELLEAMVNFYDTGDKTKLMVILARDDYFNSEDRQNMLQNKKNYDLEIQGSVKGENAQGEEMQKPTKAIEILRRLVENTKPIEDNPPITSDLELNCLMVSLHETISNQPDFREKTGHAIDYVNNKLVGMMEKHEIGIEPNQVLAIAWLERQGFNTLQGMKFEDQIGAFKQEWFTSLLKFHELTASSSEFSEDEFRTFLNSVKGAESDVEAYKLVASRVLDHADKLGGIYRKSGKTDVGALWSGNLTHELIGLTDPKPTTTEQGRKFLQERKQREIEPGYHQGD